ncbi:unnamed protein product [Auanema sp. JU1783]|nr:unnamed protein product [Auanema sp. JU1783]
MVQYKLHYFDGRGAGEIVRQIFKLAGQNFEDVRYSFETWPAAKELMPFKQVPVLEVDGKQLPQSYTIARYLGKQFGFHGRDAFEGALIDSYADQVKDWYTETRAYISVALGFAEGDIEKLKNEVLVPALNKNLPFFQTAIKNNKSGFLVGDSVSWVDLLLAELNHNNFDKYPELYAEYPELKAHFEKIHAIPAIKSWRESRPVTKF